jgi:hypothetical protein
MSRSAKISWAAFPLESGFQMNHGIKVSATRADLSARADHSARSSGAILSCRKRTIHARILNWLLGEPRRMTIIIPGDTVRNVTISEVDDTSTGDGLNE